MSRDRAEVPAGTNDDWCFNRIVSYGDDPVVAGPLQRRHRHAFEHGYPGTAQQEVVELTAPNRIADHAGILRLDEVTARPVAGPIDDSGPERCDFLERQSCGSILLRVKLEEREHTRRQPAGAHFVPWGGCA